jgi:DNA-binding MarR family transcriptional regulator
VAFNVPIRIRGDKSKTGLEAERIFNIMEWYLLSTKNISTLKLIMARALDGIEITFADWLVLKDILDNDGTATISELAERFDINIPQATVQIKKLVKKNLVKQKISLVDRRVKYLKCSRKGVKVVFDGEQSIQHAMRYWLFDLNDKEISDFTAITRKIANFEIPPSSIG